MKNVFDKSFFKKIFSAKNKYKNIVNNEITKIKKNRKTNYNNDKTNNYIERNKKYIELIDDNFIYDDSNNLKNFEIYLNREDVEWTNSWIEDCTDKNKKHILFIGDSVLREIRSVMTNLISESVDFIGTSRSFLDPKFYDIFDAFFKNNNFSYSSIFLNIGFLHGMFSTASDNPLEYKVYINSYYKFIRYISEYSNKIILINSVPNVMINNLSQLDDEINTELYVRSKIQEDICNLFGYKNIDVFNFIIENKEKFEYRDHTHFKSKVITEYLAKYIIEKAKLIDNTVINLK